MILAVRRTDLDKPHYEWEFFDNIRQVSVTARLTLEDNVGFSIEENVFDYVTRIKSTKEGLKNYYKGIKCERVSGEVVKFEIAERRMGDPAVLVASNEKAKKELNWEPEFGLEDMVQSAFEWQKDLMNELH